MSYCFSNETLEKLNKIIVKENESTQKRTREVLESKLTLNMNYLQIQVNV